MNSIKEKNFAFILLIFLTFLSRAAGAGESRAGFVLRDNDAGVFLIWLDAGKSQGIAPGMVLDVSINGTPAGSLWIDEALEFTSAGTLYPISGCPPLKSGDKLSFTKRNDAPAFSLPVIHLPEKGKGLEIAAAPGGWLPEWDEPLLENFLKFTTTHSSQVSPAITGGPPGELVPSSALPSQPSDGEPAIEAVPEMIDPDIASEVKSSWFIEAGECIHIAPWPETADGRAILVNDKQSFSYPGVGDVSTKGKTLASLEKEIAVKLGGKVTINPCKKKISRDSSLNEDALNF